MSASRRLKSDFVLAMKEKERSVASAAPPPVLGALAELQLDAAFARWEDKVEVFPDYVYMHADSPEWGWQDDE